MALPPRYVRRVTVHNTTDHAVTLLAKYQQNQATFELPAGQSVDIEGTIDHGSYTAVDPIEKITVQGADQSVLSERLFESDGGVKILSFQITGDAASGVQWVEQPHQE